MSFKITVTEIIQHTAGEANPGNEREVYRQTVDAIDLPALIRAVNQKPRRRRGEKTEAK